jgi:hypothetical protein
MIATAPISRILHTVAATSQVTNGRGRLSVQLIAPSDAGKSELLLSHLPPRARIINDFTFASMVALMKAKPAPKWIVVPDFHAAISHKPAVATLAMSLLLSLLGEGVTEVPGIDGRAVLQATRAKKRGITFALMTALTPEMFWGKRGKWRATGLLRRLVPINYTYSEATKRAIQRSIRKGNDTLEYTHITHALPKPGPVNISSVVSTELEKLSERVAVDQLRWDIGRPGRAPKIEHAVEFPFSVQKTLRQYARAVALLDGSNVVTMAHMPAILDFTRFMRYDRPEAI